MGPRRWIWLVPALVFLLTACAPATTPTNSGPGPAATDEEPAVPSADTAQEEEEQYRIVTLLPRDAIPAIDDPIFINAEQAGEQYRPDELVIGVSFEGDTRAYSVELLSSHEIVNDTVGGRKIAVTW